MTVSGAGDVHRRLSMFESMALIAATAVALVPFRIVFLETRDAHWKTASEKFIYALTDFFPPFLVLWSVTVLFLSLRKPRPSFRRLARRPGFLASLLTSLLLAFDFFTFFLSRTARDPDPQFRMLNFFNLEHTLAQHVGLMIAGAWLALVLRGAWKPSSTAIDRFGTFVGACWICLFLLWTIYPWIHTIEGWM